MKCHHLLRETWILGRQSAQSPKRAKRRRQISTTGIPKWREREESERNSCDGRIIRWHWPRWERRKITVSPYRIGKKSLPNGKMMSWERRQAERRRTVSSREKKKLPVGCVFSFHPSRALQRKDGKRRKKKDESDNLLLHGLPGFSLELIAPIDLPGKRKDLVAHCRPLRQEN